MERNSGRRNLGRASGVVWLAAASAAHAAGQVTTRVSVSTGGAQGNGYSDTAEISADGRYVTFESLSGNLVAGDTNAIRDIFVRDRQSGVTERVSVASGGGQANGSSTDPSISADGRYVAFRSRAFNLVDGDTNATYDVFVHDRLGGTTERVSVDSGGAQGNDISDLPSISGDGRYVAFESLASNLVPSDTNARYDVFLRDLQTGTTVRVSVDSGGLEGNSWSGRPAISADGRYVALYSLASNLAVGDTNLTADVFVHDRHTGTIERVSVDSNGTEANGISLDASISADGRCVAFRSYATNLVSGDTNGVYDVFVHDRQSGTTERVSVDSGGAQGNGTSYNNAISADGRYVAFDSSASNLVAGDTNMTGDAFVCDRQSGAIRRVSIGPGGAQGNDASGAPSISADGRYVAFESLAGTLVVGDTNQFFDVFVHDWQPSFSTFCSGDGLDTSHTTPCPCANVGAAGHGCANSAQPGGALLSASGSTYTDTVQLAGGAMPAASSCIYLQGDALDDATFGDGVRCTGGGLIRLRTRTNVGGASAFPDSTDTITLSARGGVAPFSGLRRHYQTYYRNAAAAFCPPETFNVTNGIVIDW